MDKILAWLPSSSPVKQPELVTNVPIKRGLERVGLRQKLPDTNPLPKVFS